MQQRRQVSYGNVASFGLHLKGFEPDVLMRISQNSLIGDHKTESQTFMERMRSLFSVESALPQKQRSVAQGKKVTTKPFGVERRIIST